MYVCDDSHDKIMDTIVSSELINHNEFILEGEVEISYDENECNKINFLYHLNVFA